jgi:hypothetical protein
MLAAVGIIALGGASDPATGPNTRDWTDWHSVGALLGTALIAWTYFAAWNNVVANQTIINKLVADVAQTRRERLSQELSAEPLSQLGGQNPS